MTFLTICKNKNYQNNDFIKFSFLLSALDRKSAQAMKSNVFCDDDFLYATDGNRCHVIYNNFGMTSGRWEVSKLNKKEIELNYIDSRKGPDIWRILNDKHPKNGFYFDNCFSSYPDQNSSILFYKFCKATEKICNFKFIHDLSLRPDTEFVAEIHKDNIIVVSNPEKDFLCVFMPLKTEGRA